MLRNEYRLLKEGNLITFVFCGAIFSFDRPSEIESEFTSTIE